MEEATARRIRVTLRHTRGCPHWRRAHDRVLRAISEEGLTVDVELEAVDTAEDAARLNFIGSPTILVDGLDPFGEEDADVGLTCRLFDTPEGLSGSPTVGQLRDALRRTRKPPTSI
jgi:hypothetical protein